MATRMLIDATHEEETRVVVVKGNRVEEFDFETAARRPLKGNIYLARVTRVEPSLQAAFVDFGGNRHGFLAFSEIHPDYYQIPVADRERLKQEEAEAAAADEDDDEDEEAEEEEEEKASDTDEAPARRRRRKTAEAGGDAGQDAGRPGEGSAAAAEGHSDAAQQQADADRAPADTAGDPAAPAGDAPSETSSPAFAPAAFAPAPASPLPERSGLRRVARLFGFGADEEPARDRFDQRADAGAGTSAMASSDPAYADEGAEPGAAVEDNLPVDSAPEESAREEGIPAESIPAESTPESDGGQGQPHLLGEVDDEDRPAEERDDQVEAFGGDAVDEVRRRSSKRRPLTRRYKIQEVIKRRQILLVQVVKEERGNKGAALTTYMSLAGRYCVLMPNSPNGGGISRKIVSATDRKRLKAITGELDVPEGMGMIVRTAGMERTRAEIKRDFEFLLRTWDNIRELTLASMAPCLVYEEANLIKRAIRDVYNKDVDEVLVEGDNGYRHAKDFMKMLMPSHSKRVQPYKDRIPLFHRYQVENQLDEMFYPTVQLKSGGYIVINATEALVAIDVNSGRSTKEHNIEGTAYKTNMEAAEEVARQLRLRDMAGLIVIDFIDMDDGRNARNVERKLKECLKLDRARIQVGRISSFGLLEMSRQRLRPSLVEQSMVVCPHCDGQGHVRSVESAAIRAIRAAEDEGIRERSAEVTLIVPTTVAIYLLNSKRDVLQEIEGRYGIRVLVKNDDELGPSDFNLERSKTRSDGEPPVQRVVTAESVPYRGADEEDDEQEGEVEEETAAANESEAVEAAEPTEAADEDSQQKGDRRGKRRRRRKRRGGEENGDETRQADARDEGDEADESDAVADDGATAASDRQVSGDGQADRDAEDGRNDQDGEPDEDEDGDGDAGHQEASGDEDGQSGRRGRRRGRRGGRRRRRRQDREEDADQVEASGEEAEDTGSRSDPDGDDDGAADTAQGPDQAVTASPAEAEASGDEQAGDEQAGDEQARYQQTGEERPGDDSAEDERLRLEPAGAEQPSSSLPDPASGLPRDEVDGAADSISLQTATGIDASRSAAVEDVPPDTAASTGTASEVGIAPQTGIAPQIGTAPEEVQHPAPDSPSDAGPTASSPDAEAAPAGDPAATADRAEADDPSGAAMDPAPDLAADSDRSDPEPVAPETLSGGQADAGAAATTDGDEAESEPMAEPSTGAVLSPEEYAAGPSATADAAPRRGWWRRPARSDDGKGESPGTAGQD